MNTCSVIGCSGPLYARTVCNAHYQRLTKTGSLDAQRPIQRKQGGECEASNCQRPARARGLCNAHLARFYTYGESRADDPIGKHWRPDNPGWRQVGAKHVNTDGYIEVYAPEHPNAWATGFGLEHRLVMSDHLERPLLPDEVVHHKNGNRKDNRIANLELCLRRQPPGQRVADLVPWARDIIARYGDLA